MQLRAGFCVLITGQRKNLRCESGSGILYLPAGVSAGAEISAEIRPGI